MELLDINEIDVKSAIMKYIQMHDSIDEKTVDISNKIEQVNYVSTGDGAMVSRGTSNPVVNQLNRSYREIKITMIYSKFAQYDLSDPELFVMQSYAGEFMDSDMFFTTAYIARMLDIPTNSSIGIDIEKNEVVTEFDGQTKTFPLSLLVERLAIDFLQNNEEYRKRFKPNFEICQDKLTIALDNFQSNIMKFDNVTFLDSENITFEQINEECTSVEVRISNMIEQYTTHDDDVAKSSDVTSDVQNTGTISNVTKTEVKPKPAPITEETKPTEPSPTSEEEPTTEETEEETEPENVINKQDKPSDKGGHNVVAIVLLIIGIVFLVGILFLIVLRQQGISKNDIFTKHKTKSVHNKELSS